MNFKNEGKEIGSITKWFDLNDIHDTDTFSNDLKSLLIQKLAPRSIIWGRISQGKFGFLKLEQTVIWTVTLPLSNYLIN